jgi:hypothetical protein
MAVMEEMAVMVVMVVTVVMEETEEMEDKGVAEAVEVMEAAEAKGVMEEMEETEAVEDLAAIKEALAHRQVLVVRVEVEEKEEVVGQELALSNLPTPSLIWLLVPAASLDSQSQCWRSSLEFFLFREMQWQIVYRIRSLIIALISPDAFPLVSGSCHA